MIFLVPVSELWREGGGGEISIVLILHVFEGKQNKEERHGVMYSPLFCFPSNTCEARLTTLPNSPSLFLTRAQNHGIRNLSPHACSGPLGSAS